MTSEPSDHLPRTLESALSRAAANFKGVMVTGMRGVGKTDLLRSMDPGLPCVNLERYRVLDLARNAPDEFFKTYPLPLLIDNFQSAPDLGLELKAILDDSTERGRVWLSMSHGFGLKNPVKESLAGRVAGFELLPLSLYEMQGKGKLHKPFLPSGTPERGDLDPMNTADIWHVIWQGSWPKLMHADSDQRDVFFDDFLNSFLEKDATALGVRRLDGFRKFLAVLAGLVGEELSIGKIKQQTGIAAETVHEWLDIAAACGIIYLLQPFAENVCRRLIKKPKLYFTDTGFAAWLCRYSDANSLAQSHAAQRFFTNFVIMEILKSWRHNGKKALFYFYRDTAKKEIDLLIRQGDIWHPVAIRATDAPRRDMIEDFAVIKGDALKRGPGALVCTCQASHYLTKTDVALPVWNM